MKRRCCPMNFKKTLIVYRKETLEVLRDKRTIFTTFILPVILYPILIVGFNSLMMRQMNVLEERGATIAVADSINSDISQDFLGDIKKIKNYTLLPYTPSSQTLYKEKDIQAILTLKDSLGTDGLTYYKISVQYDKSKEQGKMIFSNLKDALRNREKEMQKTFLNSRGLNPEVLNLIAIRELDTSTAEKKMGMFLGMFLPYIVIMMLVAGASTVAADLVAGEKERKTLETLLVSSAGRKEIVFGKYLTIITLAMLNVMINLFSISVSLKFMLANQSKDMAGVQMPVSAIFILLIAMIPLATLFAAILLSVSTFSRNMKEARTYEQPIMMLAMMMGFISFLPTAEINNLWALIPVINIALLFKAVMIHEYTLTNLLVTVGSTILLDVLAIWATIKLFTTESILFRADEESGGLKAIKKNKGNFFSPYYGIVYFSVALIVLYYLGGYLQSKDLFNGLIQTQLLIIALPVLLILRLLRMKSKEILRQKAPALKELVLIPFIAVPAAILVSLIAHLINLIYPFPKEYLEQLSRLFTMDSSTLKVFLVMAVLPGICEETLFRGFMIRFFEKWGPKWAVIISALLFALFHLDPFRFFPVLLLGILLGYLTVRSGSIYNSMLSHTINNGLALFVTTFGSAAWLKPFLSGEDSLRFWVAIPAVVVLVLALWGFHKVTEKGAEKCAE